MSSDVRNPFEAYGESRQRQRRPMRSRVVTSDAQAPMKPSAMEKAQRDQQTQMKFFREHHREELDVARKGEFGTDIIMLEKLLKMISIDDGNKLVDFIKRSELPRADVYTRRTALRLVGDGLERLRVRNGLAPFDDSLPSEAPTVFEIIRAELGVP